MESRLRHEDRTAARHLLIVGTTLAGVALAAYWALSQRYVVSEVSPTATWRVERLGDGGKFVRIRGAGREPMARNHGVAGEWGGTDLVLTMFVFPFRNVSGNSRLDDLMFRVPDRVKERQIRVSAKKPSGGRWVIPREKPQ